MTTQTRSKTVFRALLGCLAGLGLASCAPKVYVNDRHTVMEDEAAGEWPDFESGLIDQSRESGPTPLQKTGISSSQGRLYNVLNGEMTGTSGTAGQ